MRTLVTVLIGVGVLFGGVEVAVAAATDALGSSAAAGPLLALWGAGSLIGGLLAVRAWRRRRRDRLLVVSARWPPATSRSCPPPAAWSRSAVVLLVAGAAIAPTYAAVYAMVDTPRPRAP